MKRWMFVLAALLLPGMVYAQAHTLPDAPHILVKGHADGRYVPDRFSVQLQVTATDPSPGKARDIVEKRIAALFKSIDAHGAIKDLTRASSLSMSEASHYDGNKQVHDGTEVDRTVSVTFGSLQGLQRFVSDLPASKDVLVQSTSTGRSDQAELMMKLRAAAIANSKIAARQLAKAYGVRITGVYSISEVAPDFSYGVQAGSWEGQHLGGQLGGPAAPPPAPNETALLAPNTIRTQLRTGTIELSQDMYAVYLIAPDSAAQPSH